MRSPTPRQSASLFLFASMVLGPGALAQASRSNEPTPPATSANPAPPPEAKPATPAKPPEAKPPELKPAGTAATVVNLKTIEGVMGKSVRSRAGNEDMGHIVDVLVDGAGQVRAAVIDFGGFLGVGSRKVAVAWKTLDFAESIQSGSVTVALTRDQVRQAPEYKVDEPIVILEGTPQPKEPSAKEPPAKEAPAKAAAAPPPAGHNQDSPPR